MIQTFPSPQYSFFICSLSYTILNRYKFNFHNSLSLFHIINLRGYDWLNHSWASHPLSFYFGSLNVQKYHCPYLWSWQIENHSIL
ncbi:MAG TPA: hypothetical protein DD623_06415 [Streptococcus sp.]|nr:hypothetical protein [Streptococcus sp.]